MCRFFATFSELKKKHMEIDFFDLRFVFYMKNNLHVDVLSLIYLIKADFWKLTWLYSPIYKMHEMVVCHAREILPFSTV